MYKRITGRTEMTKLASLLKEHM